MEMDKGNGISEGYATLRRGDLEMIAKNRGEMFDQLKRRYSRLLKIYRVRDAENQRLRGREN